MFARKFHTSTPETGFTAIIVSGSRPRAMSIMRNILSRTSRASPAPSPISEDRKGRVGTLSKLKDGMFEFVFSERSLIGSRRGRNAKHGMPRAASAGIFIIAGFG